MPVIANNATCSIRNVAVTTRCRVDIVLSMHVLWISSWLGVGCVHPGHQSLLSCQHSVSCANWLDVVPPNVDPPGTYACASQQLTDAPSLRGVSAILGRDLTWSICSRPMSAAHTVGAASKTLPFQVAARVLGKAEALRTESCSHASMMPWCSCICACKILLTTAR
jgi:hypothetical protein